MTKKEFILVLSIAIIFTVGLFASLDTKQSSVYPSAANSGIVSYTSHEEVPKDWSQITSYPGKDNSINFKYTLSKTVPEPFVALYFHKVSGPNQYFDFSNFDEIRIHLKSIKGKRIPIYLTIDNKNYHPKSNVLLSMPLVKVIDYVGEREYKIRKGDFDIPSWWLRYHGLKREDIGDIDFSKLNYVMVNSCQTLEPGNSDEISIKSISFAHSHNINYLVYGVLMLLLAAAVALRWIVLDRKKMRLSSEINEIKILVPYKINEVDENKNSAKINRIVNYLAIHYSEPELSVQDLEKALGITAREIGSLIKDELHSSFKSYLNMIRLTEIKRLLLETDLSISDIAYRTGYNNISHFNRVFKAESGVSPKEFRAVNVST